MKWLLAVVLLGCNGVTGTEPQIELVRQWQEGDQWCSEIRYHKADGTVGGLVHCEALEGDKEVR